MAQAIVKQVLSGDTVVLMHPTKVPPQEKTLSLSYLTAPKFNRKGEKDEPFAFEAREYLRKRLIGQMVTFRVDYTIPSIKRDFGTIFLGDENINVSLVKEGLAKVKEPRQDTEPTEEHQELLDAQKIAIEEKRKWHQTDQVALKNAIKDVKREGINTQKLFNELKGKTKTAIVEYVRDGSSLRVTILPSLYVLPINMTGIQAPKMGADENAQPEEFAREARHFTETRLLGREVQIVIEHIDKYGNLFGSVLFPSQDQKKQRVFQEELLANGLAKIAEWNIANTKFVSQLRQAENVAKEKRLRLFRDYVPPKASAAGTKEYQAKVVEVISGDLLVVQNTETGEESRISLSSIRAPRFVPKKPPTDEAEQRPASAQQKQAAQKPQAQQQTTGNEFGYEAKEFLRKKIIGKPVTVRVDYIRTMSAPKKEEEEEEGQAAPKEEKRAFCTVLYGNNNANVAQELVSQGYATVIRHRADEEKSSAYDSLITAEVAAKEKKLGLHGNLSKAKTVIVNDISTGAKTATKAKSFLKFFEGKGTFKAIVERVHTGSRFKLYIPSMSIAVNFTLSGASAPSFNRRAGKDVQPDPYAQESMQFMRNLILQREIDIEVDSIDKVGSFVGNAFFQKKNVAVPLLEQGLARLQPAAERTNKYFKELEVAEAAAKAAKRNIWSVEGGAKSARPQRQRPTRQDDNRIVLAQPDEFIEVTVTEILDASHFYVQTADSIEPLQQITTKLESLHLDNHKAHHGPKVGEMVLAKYSEDNNWYRAKVLQVDESAKEALVLFVDYGSSEAVSFTNLRNAQLDATIKGYPEQAKECFLAFIDAPDEESDYFEEAAHCLSDFVNSGKKILAKVEFRDGADRLHVTLHDGETTAGSILVRNGLATLNRRFTRKNLYVGKPYAATIVGLLEDLKYAKENHLGMFEYGDITAYSDDEM